MSDDATKRTLRDIIAFHCEGLTVAALLRVAIAAIDEAGNADTVPAPPHTEPDEEG